jgi:hypothetical protein
MMCVPALPPAPGVSVTAGATPQAAAKIVDTYRIAPQVSVYDHAGHASTRPALLMWLERTFRRRLAFRPGIRLTK